MLTPFFGVPPWEGQSGHKAPLVAPRIRGRRSSQAGSCSWEKRNGVSNLLLSGDGRRPRSRAEQPDESSQVGLKHTHLWRTKVCLGERMGRSERCHEERLWRHLEAGGKPTAPRRAPGGSPSPGAGAARPGAELLTSAGAATSR